MATADSNQASNQLEFPKLKCFLYKYTPEFIPNGTKTTGLLRIDKFRIELDESKYFSKYDITKYVGAYTYDQDLYGNTYSWSLTLQDSPLSLSQLKELKVEGPDFVNVDAKIPTNLSRNITPAISTVSLTNLAQYESQDSSTQEDVPVIRTAKLNRGHTEPELVDKATGIGKETVGLRLSDLIQPYDMVSLYLYKETTPLEDLTGEIVEETVATIFPVVNNKIITFAVSPVGTHKLTSAELQKESILQSPDPIISGKTLFSNEFNGFVIRKTMTRRVGGVDTIAIQGNGITRLLGATRRILKSALLEDSIYDISAEFKDLRAITALQHIFAGLPIEQIIIDLLDFVYNIKTNVDKTTSTVEGNLSSGKLLAGTQTIVTSVVPKDSFYDITSIEVGNSHQTNRFTIPPFLLGLVMKRKLFNFREINPSNLSVNLEALNAELLIQAVDGTQDKVNLVLNQTSSLQNIFAFGQSPVLFDATISGLQGYFQFIREVFGFFNPETKTPFEILDELKRVTFVEIFERPNGVIEIRNPQYNSISSVHFSSDLDIVDIAYSETMEDFISKQKVGYGHEVIGQMIQAQEFAYTDGKFLLQYGFMESAADVNPNVKDDRPKNDQTTRDRDGILYRYAEFFLRVHNAKLKTGTVTANLDPSVQIGDTFFDEKNQKFGYIVGLSKNIVVGQTITMTLQLSYVRDAYTDKPGEKDKNSLFFDVLPTLVSIDKPTRETTESSVMV